VWVAGEEPNAGCCVARVGKRKKAALFGATHEKYRVPWEEEEVRRLPERVAGLDRSAKKKREGALSSESARRDSNASGGTPPPPPPKRGGVAGC